METEKIMLFESKLKRHKMKQKNWNFLQIINEWELETITP